MAVGTTDRFLKLWQISNMQKITPFLWFENNLKEITDFYLSVFPGSKLISDGEIENTPSGTVQTASLEIFGTNFNLMAAGPYLPFNPSVSFLISCDSPDEVESLWGKLSLNGKILMPLSKYPFADKYGWAEDQYGVSWQVMFSSTMKSPQKVTPTLLFAGSMCSKAIDAVNFYTELFHNSKINYVVNYEKGESEEPRAQVKHAGIEIENFNIALMDSGNPRSAEQSSHDVKPGEPSFKQAISLVIGCDSQEEIDYYWNKLTEGGEEIQCGWLNDKFGFPWQVVPEALSRLLSSGTKEQTTRVTEAFMKMKKFDIKKLEEAFEGKGE